MMKEIAILQDRQTGAEANHYGRDCGKRIAVELGAVMLSDNSNECLLNGERVALHCARGR